MSSQRSASGPVGRQVRSARCRRWVTRRQKSQRRAGHPLRGVLRAPRPRSTRRARPARPGTARPAAAGRAGANAKSRVRTPRWATCRSRSARPTAACRARRSTSSPCAQVSMSRAVAIDAALIGGPNQGSRAPAGKPASALGERRPGPAASAPAARAGASARPRRAASSTTRPRRARRRPRAANPRGRVAARSACSSVQARWAIWWAIVQPSAGGLAEPGGLLELGHHAVERVRTRPAGRRAAVPAPPRRPPARRRRCRPVGAEPTEAGHDLARGLPVGQARQPCSSTPRCCPPGSTTSPPPPATSRPADTPGCGRRRSTTTRSSPCSPPGQATDTAAGGHRDRGRVRPLADDAGDDRLRPPAVHPRPVRPRAGHPDQGARRAAVLHAVEPAGRAHAGVRGGAARHLGRVAGRHARCASRASTTGTP